MEFGNFCCGSDVGESLVDAGGRSRAVSRARRERDVEDVEILCRRQTRQTQGGDRSPRNWLHQQLPFGAPHSHTVPRKASPDVWGPPAKTKTRDLQRTPVIQPSTGTLAHQKLPLPRRDRSGKLARSNAQSAICNIAAAKTRTPEKLPGTAHLPTLARALSPLLTRSLKARLPADHQTTNHSTRRRNRSSNRRPP